MDRDLDARALTRALADAVGHAREALVARPRSVRNVQRLGDKLHLAASLGCDLDPWKVQNTLFELARTHLPQMQRNARGGDPDAARWVQDVVRAMQLVGLSAPAG